MQTIKEKKYKRKKKVGRPKKRGPKKKRIRRKIIKVHKPRPVIDYKIVSIINGKQNGYIGSFKTYADAYKKMEELQELNNKVVFPRKYINKETIYNIKEEYLMLEKNRFGDKKDGIIRNEFGKFVTNKIINNTKWVIREKCVKISEETFWVYGYDPKLDRKTFTWIYQNLLLNQLENKYDIIRFFTYKNKVIIKYDDKPMKMIMCKNCSDAIRVYNLISDKIKESKIKQIIPIGSYNAISQSRRELEQELMDLTGWDKRKIQRSTN